MPISLSASVFAALSLCILRVSPLSVSGCNSFREGFSAPHARARVLVTIISERRYCGARLRNYSSTLT